MTFFWYFFFKKYFNFDSKFIKLRFFLHLNRRIYKKNKSSFYNKNQRVKALKKKFNTLYFINNIVLVKKNFNNLKLNFFLKIFKNKNKNTNFFLEKRIFISKKSLSNFLRFFYLKQRKKNFKSFLKKNILKKNKIKNIFLNINKPLLTKLRNARKVH